MVWEEEAEDYGIRAANAAERALAIDADNADAAAALVIRRNWLGSWADHERGLRAVLARHPAHPRTRAELGFLFSEAGRWADALQLFETLAAADQLPARFHELHGTALAARGRRLDADRFLERAMTRWPGNSMLWAARFEFLLASGRLSEARAMVTERARFEMPNPPLPMDLGLKVATALEPRGSAGDRARAAADVLAARGSGGIWSPAAARLLVLLGEPRGALDIARAYLVGGTLPGGQTVAPPRGKRRSDFLFQSFMAPLRATDGFPALMTAIGLDAYWRQTRSAPQIIGWRH
jgi:tetratricopeptide (TPR) repeat protein